MNALNQARHAGRALLREAFPLGQWFPVSDLTLEMWLRSELLTGKQDADWMDEARTVYFWLANRNDPECLPAVQMVEGYLLTG